MDELIDAVCFIKSTKPHSKDEAPTIIRSEVSPTLNVFDVGDTRTNVFVVQRAEDDDCICTEDGDEHDCGSPWSDVQTFIDEFDLGDFS